MKLKTCKAPGCNNKFQPWSSLQQVCCPIPCALELARYKKKKKQDKEFYELKRRVRANDRSAKTEAAQRAFNAYIKVRDKDEPCISCGTTTGRWNAGHYRTVAAWPELRFHPMNNHKQCVRCNKDLSGNLIDYRINLVKKIGEANVKWLEGPHSSQHRSLEDLNDIAKYYREQTKLLEDENN